MKIQRSVLDPAVAGITLTGEFDAFAANPFLEQVEAIVQGGVVNVVANLRLVLFINSTAIGSLIKARKRVRGLGGDLVLAEPSHRVQDTLKTLGLAQVIRCFPTEQAAIQALLQSGQESVAVPSDNSVLVHAPDGARIVARMASLDERALSFVAPADTQLATGTEVKVKFRLPLFRQAYYFHLPCTVKSSQKVADGTRFGCEFGEILEEDQRAIGQFVRDLRLLKDEIRSAEA